jgi:hypothetical protein
VLHQLSSALEQATELNTFLVVFQAMRQELMEMVNEVQSLGSRDLNFHRLDDITDGTGRLNESSR